MTEVTRIVKERIRIIVRELLNKLTYIPFLGIQCIQEFFPVLFLDLLVIWNRFFQLIYSSLECSVIPESSIGRSNSHELIVGSMRQSLEGMYAIVTKPRMK